MSGITAPNQSITYTSGFSELNPSNTFSVRINLEDIDVKKIILKVKEPYDELPVRIQSINSAAEFPEITEFVPKESNRSRISFSVGRNMLNHPNDKIISTQVTVQAFTPEGDLIGEDVVELLG